MNAERPVGETPAAESPVAEAPVGETPVAEIPIESVPETKEERTWSEEIELAGNQLVEQVKEWIAEGNVRKLNINSESGDVFLSVPLTGGALAGGILVLGAPWLALIAGVAGLLAKVKLEVVRSEPPPADDDVDI